MKNAKYLLAVAVMPLALAGCSTGGTSAGPGGSGGAGGVVNFTKFTDIEAGTTTRITGIGTEVVATLDDEGQADSISAFTEPDDVNVDVSYDGNKDIASAVLTTPSGTRTWDTSNSTENVDAPSDLFVADRTDDSGFIAAARPEVSGFEYQTYGAWVADSDDGTQKYGGAYSVGSATPDDDPATNLTDDPIFTGTAAGVYVDAEGERHAITATANLSVASATKMIAFSTSGSKVDFVTANGDFDMTGNLVYVDGINGFSGTVTTGNGMTGNADGRFYGPGAAEAGGIFGLAKGNERLAGGFGATRAP